ncbi:hypothetical protein COB55_03995 [Candidatus Wolfebacteria bacterium]|nr:MAG: hypothetical protein COB55_03995 [Candidatus Wolfebacteria bacterium]
MNLTEECKKEIKEYLIKNGWECRLPLFENDELSRGYFLHSKKSIRNKLKDRFNYKNGVWGWSYKSFDKCLLEYIGPILRNHNIIKFTICHGFTYTSTTWKYNDITRN